MSESSGDIFVKLHVDPVRSGLIAEMGADLYAALTVIAAHMDADGRCYPSQASIGRMLGVSRQTANTYVQRLLAFRWRGEPVLTVEHERGPRGTFGRNVYTVSKNSGITIF